MRLRIAVTLLFLFAAAPAAGATGAHAGVELTSVSDGDPLLAVVLGRVFDHPRSYVWHTGLEISITAIEGRRRFDGEPGFSVDYRRDAVRYWWGWQNRQYPAALRVRVGTVVALEHEAVPDGIDSTQLTAGAFGGVGIEWHRRLRTDFLFDMQQHLSLMLSMEF